MQMQFVYGIYCNYLISIEIKGSKFVQYENAKIKGRIKDATNEWKNGTYRVK